MSETNFLVFNENPGDTSTTYTDSEYAENLQRQVGVVPGIADSHLHNKLFRQTSAMTYALAQVLVITGFNAIDSDIEELTNNIISTIRHYSGSADLQERVSSLETQTSNMAGVVNNNSNNIDTLTTEIETNRNDISSLQARAAFSEQNIDTLVTITAVNSENISTLGGRVTTLEESGGEGGQVGDIIASPAPSRKGSLLCDGTEYNAAEYPKLAKISSDFDVSELVENVNADSNNSYSATATYSGSAAQAFDDNDSSYWRMYSGAGGDYYLTCEYAEAKEIEAVRFQVAAYNTSVYTMAKVEVKNEDGTWESLTGDMLKDELSVKVNLGILTFFVNLHGVKVVHGVRIRLIKVSSLSSSFYVYSFQAGKISKFRVPNLQDRTIFGANVHSLKIVGMASGSLSVALSLSNLPSHAHTFSHTHPITVGHAYIWDGGASGSTKQGTSGTYMSWVRLNTAVSGTTGSASTATTSSVGSGTAVNIENSNVRMNYFIIHGETE